MLEDVDTPFAEWLAATRKFLGRTERGNIDLPEFRAAIDALDGDFGSEARGAQKAGAHLVNGNVTAASWIARTCKMSVTSAADRLRVGEQLESMPKVSAALSSGEIGYQSASQLSRLRDKLGDKRDLFNEEEMLGFAREFSVRHLRELCDVAWHVVDPDGFFKDAEENYSRRRLHISQLADGMYRVDGLLEPVTAAALKTVVDSLAKRKCPEDERTAAQRRHAPPAKLELSLPISTRTLERITCDSTMSRVLLADSMVIDVGRATRTVSGPTRRALRTRDKGCRFTGCDRPVEWSNPHHIVHWARGGSSDTANMVLLCYFHHHLVHEGGWQVINSGREFRFLPPERVFMRRVRGPGMRWAA